MSSVAKQKQDQPRSGFWAEMFQFGLYKPNQGRIVRQVTFAAITLLFFLVGWEMYRVGFFDSLGGGRYLAWLGITAAGAWFAFRLVNYSALADFFIAVEAEMNKVSWPTKKEMWRASQVVIFVIFALAAFLFVFDAIWTFIFETIGIRYSERESILIRIFRWIFGG